jgi:hypothetical protein
MRQQYLMSQGSPPPMKIARLFSAESLMSLALTTPHENSALQRSLRAFIDELVASFSHRLTLLKYGEKMHAYAASRPLERTSKRGSDHAPFVRHTATACHAFF